MMGLVVAERLAGVGHHVTVFDRGSQLGGLSTWHDYGECIWDKFYHVILPSDRHLIELLRQLGLGESLRWRQTRTGYYRDGRSHSLSNTLEFLSFPLLSPFQKARLAWTIFYGSKLLDWQSLESVTSEDWLVKHSGRATYEAFWQPLMMAKLGRHYRSVSAVFIWSYIKRLFSARDASVGKEQLGHVEGGYRSIIDALAARIQKNGDIRLGQTIDLIEADGSGRLSLRANHENEDFDRIVFTGPSSAVKDVVREDLVEVDDSSGQVRYLGAICLVLLTRKALTPYYVLNLADHRMPFTGVIGMSNVVPLRETGGLFLTYFPSYLDSADPMFEQDDEALISQFLPPVRRLFPDLGKEDIVEVHINRARIVQPLQVLNFSQQVPKIRTQHPGLFVLNTGQFANATVNNNQVVKFVSEFLETNASAFHLPQEALE
jgi:protoporphyrinogen oxidase